MEQQSEQNPIGIYIEQYLTLGLKWNINPVIRSRVYLCSEPSCFAVGSAGPSAPCTRKINNCITSCWAL